SSAHGRVRKARDDHEALDLALLEGAQERRIIAERHAPVGLSAGTEHVGMRQDAIAAVHVATARGNEANGPYAVEHPLAQHEGIDFGRCRASIPEADVARIVLEAAEP